MPVRTESVGIMPQIEFVCLPDILVAYNPLTLIFKKSIIVNMLTEKDVQTLIKEMKNIFATKDEVVQFKDQILKEIKDLRDDVTVVVGYRDTIEDHEQRITKLERPIVL